jgi:hypothetical protein
MIPGLQIRTWKDGTCKWSVRTRLYDKQRRYDLGQVCEGDRDEAPAICLRTASARAFKVKEMCGARLLPTRPRSGRVRAMSHAQSMIARRAEIEARDHATKIKQRECLQSAISAKLERGLPLTNAEYALLS